MDKSYNLYSEKHISTIKDYIKTHCYASDNTTPTFNLFITLLLLFINLYLIHKTSNYYLLFILIIFLSLVMMRLFMIFHDLCHKSFFPTNERKEHKKGFNMLVANIINVFCLFDANHWESLHSTHHKVHGNINEYDGTRSVLTSSEYDKLSKNKQLLYDIFRTPIIFFLLTPIYIFWVNKIINGDIIYMIKYLLLLYILYKIGSTKLLVSFLIAQYIDAVFGIIMFHLQHQVNVGYWKPIDKNDKLSKDNAELLGASVVKIPWFLEYFTNGIEYHNIHHLDPGIPSYNMKKCYYELVNLGLIPDNKIGYNQSFTSLFHTIFNEKTQLYE